MAHRYTTDDNTLKLTEYDRDVSAGTFLADVNGSPEAEAVAAELRRKRRNAKRRANYRAHRDLGLVRTPYGWE
jgi:hypothetical protein